MAKRTKYRKAFPLWAKYKKILSALKYFAFLSLFLAFGVFFLFIYFAKDLPRPEKFTERQFTLPTKIYDREGKVLLYQIYAEEKRTVIPSEEVPYRLKQAIIAAEDANFYNHFGLDFRGIARAVLVNLRLGQPLQGASTISQQLIRSTFLGTEKTATRKIREIILTLELERKHSKEEILEWYLNQVPFGANAYGVEAASQSYFNKHASEISLSEAALLASLIRAPSYLSPYGPNKEQLMARKNYVLDQMNKLGYISEAEAKEA
ncbi:MAG: transglycosylase domain-containing protein, partial [Candidatus Nealsonbacteria bacterium]|nr:transglycosylase domain-containing protein [Candidatus Nealsonbacteria bacterium]